MKTFDLNESGQTILVDLTFALLIFLLVFNSINAAYISSVASVKERSRLNEMQLKATQAIESLVSFEGTPSNWEELPLQQVQEIGLADESKTINEAKLNAFKNLSADYNSTKVLLNLGLFDYFFSLKGADDVNAGLPATTNATQVQVKRIVTYKGEEAIVEFTLYSLS
ncbi:MAG: hypothetical protein J4224_05565 [Candidatus Diapherotrites archaeon]|uniref:Uncharacterized protein n=1 Tax=Candidatus Iainarchaeum sp. TaxID=3101447 RepID=A0A7J4IXD7_9ARCH|nr:MAG: hypothetical protein QT03_C0001G0982 [archaeon GW2011_AR10]MBS3059858.1 hypothetical protein [Candidatus Diapherotrites archaeon]HIH08915.1 hypothetical protein [Candidatus Diapherotrites archaeon]